MTSALTVVTSLSYAAAQRKSSICSAEGGAHGFVPIPPACVHRGARGAGRCDRRGHSAGNPRLTGDRAAGNDVGAGFAVAAEGMGSSVAGRSMLNGSHARRSFVANPTNPIRSMWSASWSCPNASERLSNHWLVGNGLANETVKDAHGRRTHVRLAEDGTDGCGGIRTPAVQPSWRSSELL